MSALPLLARLAERLDPPKVRTPTFRGANLEAQRIVRPEWMNAGPADTGKTWAALWRLDTEARNTPGGYFAIIRKVRADYVKFVRRTWHRTIAVRGGVEIRGGADPSSYLYTGSGAEVIVIGLDRDRSVLSAEFDGAYVNQAEELALSDWEFLSTRVTGRGATTDHPMLFGDCNPGPPTHWIVNRPRLQPVLYATHKDNPELYDDAGAELPGAERRLAPLRALTGVRRKRLFLGEWVAAEGTVYEFDRARHVISREDFEKIAISRRMLAIDFGFSHAFVCQLWALDSDGRLYLEREIYRTKTLLVDHIQTIRTMTEGLTLEDGVADCEDPQSIAMLNREGIAVRPAVKGADSVDAGLQVVRRRLQDPGDGKARLRLVEGALVERDEELAAAHKPTSTAEEFEVYVLDRTRDGSTKEVPVKENDHGMDAMRYLVSRLDGLDMSDAAGWEEWATKARGQAPSAAPTHGAKSEDLQAVEAWEEREKAARAATINTMASRVACSCGHAWTQQHSPVDERVICSACGTSCPLV